MPITFEVKETDLMGRIGTLKVGGKSIETPCLVPVIHPVLRDIPLAKYTEMGFGALMTNSFITYKRRREEALEKGLHKMLDYDGVIMTDSGGYQVLQYGQVDMTPSVIAEFQAAVGSDLAVTLDRPTGYSLSEEYARETMKVSLDGARETIKKFGNSATTWVGPIQGGLFDPLVRASTKALLKAGFEVLALGSPVEMMDNYLFGDLVRMIVAARRVMPYSVPLHLFGAGHPLTLPLSVALGCDTFDSASYVLFARRGRYMTERGTLILEEMTYLPCSCPTCNSTTKTDLVLMERRERVNKLSLHNLYLLRQDVQALGPRRGEGRGPPAGDDGVRGDGEEQRVAGRGHSVPKGEGPPHAQRGRRGSAGAGHGAGPPGTDHEEAVDGRHPSGAGERRATVEERALPAGAPAHEEGSGARRVQGPPPAGSISRRA
jgi:7-cyano-7-deazaguanine tRNA-ribosyltransferase